MAPGRWCSAARARSVWLRWCEFYGDLRAAYPWAERIYVVPGQDWPVHTHPDVLVALEAQTSPFAFHRPPSWPTTPSAAAVTRWTDLALPIQIVPLPTYASWCNPIEKLWRKLRQEVTHSAPLGAGPAGAAPRARRLSGAVCAGVGGAAALRWPGEVGLFRFTRLIC